MSLLDNYEKKYFLMSSPINLREKPEEFDDIEDLLSGIRRRLELGEKSLEIQVKWK